MKTIRIIDSKLQIAIPLWVRQELDIDFNSMINFTPVCGMLLMTAGKCSDLDLECDPRFDYVYIPSSALNIVGLDSYDLVEITKLGKNIYVTPYKRMTPKCQLCKEEDSVVDLQGIDLCSNCVDPDLLFILEG